METAHELLMGLSDGEFDELRKVRDSKGYDAAIEFLTPKFSARASEIVSELDRIDNFAKPKAEEVTEEAIPTLVNIAEEGQEAQFVPNPVAIPTFGAAPIINEKILQDPALKANDIQDGMQAGQATGAQIAMNRINDTKIQQFSNPALSYTDALDLIREMYLKDLKKEVFDEMLAAYKSKSESSNGETEVTSILSKYELPLEGIDGIVDTLSKVKEDTDNFGSKNRFVRVVNFDKMSDSERAAVGAAAGGASAGIAYKIIEKTPYLGAKTVGRINKAIGEKAGKLVKLHKYERFTGDKRTKAYKIHKLQQSSKILASKAKQKAVKKLGKKLLPLAIITTGTLTGAHYGKKELEGI
jgi:hypothetical protein